MDVAYIFPGQGAQYVGMGKELCETYPRAKEIFDKANEILDFDLKKLCFEGPREELATTLNSQPAILTHSVALLRVLESRNQDIQPKYALGLSLGEFTALVASGCISFEDGVALVRKRGEFMDEASQKNPGKMVSILGMDFETVEKLCKGIGDCEIANLNCPGQIVVSGKVKNIELLAGLAKDTGAKRAVMLEVSGAFHSSLMTPAKEKIDKEIEKISFNTPEYPVVCNITAEPTTDIQEIKKNISNHVISQTYWEKSIRFIASQGIDTYLEIGPGKVLRGLLRKIDPKLKVINFDKPQDFEQDEKGN